MEQKKFYSEVTGYYDEIFPLNPLQVEFVRDEFRSLDELYFLDAGCSTGKLAHELSQLGALGVGIDLNEEMIGEARKRYSSAFLTFKTMDMIRIDRFFPATYFDVVICFGNTLVHLDSLAEVKAFLSQAAAVLKPGGKLLLQILNYDYILDSQITELPLIRTEKLEFRRYYALPGPGQKKLSFKTVLTDYSCGREIVNEIPLLPLRKKELEKLLLFSGFKTVRFYGGFRKEPFTGEHLPLITVAENDD